MYIDNALRNIASVENGRNHNIITRTRAFSESDILNIHGSASPHPNTATSSNMLLRNAEDDIQSATLTQTQMTFIHNPHKREFALDLYNEIAQENLPEEVKNLRCNVTGENLKTFIGIIASQRDNFSAQEKNEFARICQKFKGSLNNPQKQEKVYGLMRNLLTRYGKSAFRSHYSYFIGFCKCAWQYYHGVSSLNYNGDDLFKRSIHACKENIDRYIDKLVNASELEDVAICKAAEEFKNNTIAIPLTLKFQNREGGNSRDVEQNATINSELPVSQEPENVSVTDTVEYPVTFSKEKKESGDIHLHLSIENIGNNNGSHNSSNLNGPQPSLTGNIADQIYNRLFQDILRMSGTERTDVGIQAGGSG
ncbi:TPA: hypothetical protein J1413_004862, partial [Escherichia coli]|nr:hypothetical protein [Escherichia coli]HBA9523022.1 hypothetical protein [Escherichia coli]